MKYNFQLGIIIGLLFGVGGCHLYDQYIHPLCKMNQLLEDRSRWQATAFEIQQELDSMKDENHIYKLNVVERQAYDRQTFYSEDTIGDTMIMDSLPDSLEMP